MTIKKELNDWLVSLTIDATPSLDECIKYLGEYFPLLYKFKETKQDPIWHSEGNVHIHTQMVLNELYKILNNITISPYKRQSLILGALLHDIAKPLTTYVCKETGRVKSPKHEIKGKEYLTYKLLDLELNEDVYLEVLELVGQHQKPKLLVIKNEENYKYHKLMRDCDYMQLYYLELADMRGRTCEDLDIQLMYLEEFKEKCDKLIQEHILANDEDITLNCKGLYGLSAGEVNSFYEFVPKYGYNTKGSTVTLMCAVSGTGKSTFISNHFSMNDQYIIISLDDIRAELSFREDQSRNKEVVRIAQERFKQALREKKNIVWDATNTRKEHREKLITTAMNYGSLVSIQVLLTKESTTRIQNKNRQYSVPDTVITKQINQFQLPSKSEAHVVQYWVNY